MNIPDIRIGTAGWSIPSRLMPLFPAAGTHLERYAQRFGVVEINSSFYRPHRPESYERWAASVPAAFRFSVKLPKSITHDARLHETEGLVERFAGDVAGLGEKLGAILIQLPPSLIFDLDVARRFALVCRKSFAVPLALEPRHPSWFEADADRFLVSERIARVAADPARVPSAATPGGWRGFSYFRLHGSPQVYRSPYADRLPQIAAQLRAEEVECWCIFDNTTSMAAIPDAVGLCSILT